MIIDSRYKITEKLGSGNWATVYKVIDIRTNNHCILKSFQQLSSSTIYEKFSAEEMHLITRLEHPNLVPVISFGNDKDHIYYVREYYEGSTLQNYKFKLNQLDQFYDLVVQCLYALDALHTHKIYHKAIKPSNILYLIPPVSPSQDKEYSIEVKLIDYGFNKVDTDRKQQTITSTLPYLAPEIITKQGFCPQSDLYSIGVTLYMLTTGTLPFSIEQITSLMIGNQQNIFPKFIREINPDIPVSLEKFIMKLLEKYPEDRFLNVQEAIQYINNIQNKTYSFSQKLSLIQKIKFNSYIVRDDYTHLLVDLIKSVSSKNGKLITLLGGDGIGKVSLLTLFKYHFLTNKYHIFDYTCSKKHQDPFFALFKEFNTSIKDNEKKNNIFYEISEKFKLYLTDSEDSFVEKKSEMTPPKISDRNMGHDFDLGKKFLVHLSNDKPLIFIIKEAQHITTETINFLNSIYNTILNNPIIIIISTNDPSKLKKFKHSIQVKIESLSIDETRSYLKKLLDLEPTENFVKQMWFRSSGNPYYIRNILIDLINNKEIIVNNTIDFSYDFENYALPEHIKTRILSRFNSISPKNLNFLKKLSIVNTPISKDLMRSTLNILGQELFIFLDEVKDNNIIRGKDDVYEFTFIEYKQKLFGECTREEILTTSKELIQYYESITKYTIDDCKGIIKNAIICKDNIIIRQYRMNLVKLYKSQNDQIEAFFEAEHIIKLDLSDKVNVSEEDIIKDLMQFIELSDLTGFVNEALETLLKCKKKIDRFEWYYSFAILFYKTENYKKSEKYFELAFPLIETKTQKIRFSIDLSAVLASQGRYFDAEYYLTNLPFDDLDDELEVLFFDRYGSFLIAQNKEDEAIVWYENCQKKIYEKQPNISIIVLGDFFHNLGTLFIKRKMFQDAKIFLISCIKEWERINYHRLLGIVYNNMGDIFLRQGETNEAISYFLKAENIAKKNNNKKSLAITYKFYAETEIKRGDFLKAEYYLIKAKTLLAEIHNDEYKNIIDNNLALIRIKIKDFSYFNAFLKSEYPDVLENNFTNINPLIKSYILFLYELGDVDKLQSIINFDLNFSSTQDDDFYYQIFAFMATLKGDFCTAINNFQIALDFAKKTKNHYAIAIINIYLSICFCRLNNINKAHECLDESEIIICKYDYMYWKTFMDITRLRLLLLDRNISLRTILRTAFSLLPDIEKNKYFLLEIELYTIIIQIYYALKSSKMVLMYKKIYKDKINNAVKYLPEADKVRYQNHKKSSLNKTNSIDFHYVAPRNLMKSIEWNETILSILRLEDATRIEELLNKYILQYFSPHSYAVMIFKKELSKHSIMNSDYDIYMQYQFNPDLLKDEEFAEKIGIAILNQKIKTFSINKINNVVCPLELRNKRIGFFIIQDNGEMPFSSHELRLINLFSFHLSIMLIKLSEFNEIKLKASFLSKFMEASNKIIQTHNMDNLLNYFVMYLINITGANRGFLINKIEQDNYRYHVSIDHENNMIEKPSGISKSIVFEVFNTKQPVFIDNLPSKRNLYFEEHANSLYCAPILIDNQIFAILYIDNYCGKTSDDIAKVNSKLIINQEMLNIFINQVSVAIKNSQTYQSLLEKNKELLNLEDIKTNFIKVVSHELNTPLVTLQIYIEALRKKTASSETETQDLLAKISKSTDKLRKTIQVIIDLNRYKTIDKLQRQDTDITDVLKGLHNEIIFLSSDRKLKVLLEIEENLPLLKIDKHAFEMMIMHLLSNAVRFTADYGRIVLGARKATFLDERIDNKDSIVIYVQDNGMGIPEKETENIFKEFYELGDIYSHSSGFLEFRSGGLGVGLSISKKIAELHKGKIWFKSKEKEETTFYISIPISDK